MHIPLRLAIWDVDGTLVDSRQVIQSAMVQAFEAVGLTPPPYAETRKIVGLDLAEACGILAPPGYDALEDLIGAYKHAFIALRSAPDFEENLYPGAVEMLDDMAQAGWILAIATGKSRQGLNALFARHPLEPYFDTIWCADDGPGKPNPFMCEQAMRAVGADPEHTVMIGDAVHDMRMALNAQVSALGVSWGFGETDELHTAGAQSVSQSFTDLRNTLVSLPEARK